MALALATLSNRGLAQALATSRPALVELFTSEGCSSCPPAEAVLGELATQPNVVALAFHVDYWDSIGWIDRFSIPEAVQRQNRYVTVLGLSSAFTPQIVVDGRSSLVGSDRQRVVAAINHSSNDVSVTLNISGGELRVGLPAGHGRGDCDVNFVAYLSHASTAIARGENSGRTLKEFNIVRTFRHLGTWEGQERTFKVPISSLPTDADRVAVFLQLKNQGAIVGAAAANLPVG